MMVLFLLAAMYMIVYPWISKDLTGTEAGGDAPAEFTTYEPAENSAQVLTGDDETGAQDATQAAIAAIEEKEKNTYNFRYPDRLTGHFEKHGIEMGYSSEEEYLAGANSLINNPDALTKTEAEDGDKIYFLESTNEIAFVSTDGYIRTYFICSGKDYFDRQ
jgi:hypothetical protein